MFFGKKLYKENNNIYFDSDFLIEDSDSVGDGGELGPCYNEPCVHYDSSFDSNCDRSGNHVFCRKYQELYAVELHHEIIVPNGVDLVVRYKGSYGEYTESNLDELMIELRDNSYVANDLGIKCTLKKSGRGLEG